MKLLVLVGLMNLAAIMMGHAHLANFPIHRRGRRPAAVAIAAVA